VKFHEFSFFLSDLAFSRYGLDACLVPIYP
jgi:hypothetical protein